MGYAALRIGSKGIEVSCLQAKLGIFADGNFGLKTKVAVTTWQIKKALTPDGIFGAHSRAILVANSSVAGNFPVGCESASGFSITTGLSCSLTSNSQSPVNIPNTTGHEDTICPIYQTWNGTTCVIQTTNQQINNASLSSNCPLGQTYNGSACINSITLDDSSSSIPQYQIKEKSITFLTPVGGEIYHTAKNLFPQDSGKIGYATEGDTIPFTWRWTGSGEHVWPVVYLYNVDTQSVGEFIHADYNNYGISQGYITGLRSCIDGLFCFQGYSGPGQYKLKLCEFPDDKNPQNNALYPVGATPLCSFSPIFSIRNPE